MVTGQAGIERGGATVIRQNAEAGGSSSASTASGAISPGGNSLGAARLDANGQLLIAANSAGVERDRATLVHGPSLVSLDRFFQCDFALHSG